ncbi:MAG: hypothetical protein CR986_05220 [Ignavibacteriae bacterium]|nr:MAG: hypothetical protein CR986_05220 [Ignavibacteriota bacterium]
MKFSYQLAKKFISSKQGSKFFSLISVITIGGITLGVAVLIMSFSILNGFDDTVSKNIINFNAHINISGYSGHNLPNHKFVEHEIKSKLASLYSNFSAYISEKVIISKRDISEGIILNGVKDSFFKSSSQRIPVEGNFNLNKNPEGIILGKKLAELFNVKVGDNVVIFALENNQPPSLTNLPLVEQFEVIGIYESGMAEYDDIYAFINFNKAKKIFNIKDEVSGYNINLYDISKIENIKSVLNDFLRYPFYVRGYREINKHIFTWLELQKKPIPIILGLIIIVAVFNIIGAVLMLIIQKTGAIGILKTLGANRKQIMQLFIFQGIALAIIGIILGNLLAITLSFLQNTFNIIELPKDIYYLSSVPITIDFNVYILVSLTAFILALIISIIPSYIASKIQPINAIKFN